MFRKRRYTYRDRKLPDSLLLIVQAQTFYFRAQRVRTDDCVA